MRGRHPTSRLTRRSRLSALLPDDELAGLVKAFREKAEEIADDVREAFEKFSDEAQYEFDKQLGKVLSEHPELYAELRKTGRQVRRTLDKLSKDLGLK